ncbi:methylmalonyl-CoA epimerase [Candidatus Villigracilis saccharophilus]|uniref:methylmalonyl-CoA epimerase n=1 Tax=Candidatus Villigracilis saccharophilus TaxID=3140684 RepID=UPI0031370BDE|nr:methylmalonyl-CoA epimerase [Anaerolineales bacterium]
MAKITAVNHVAVVVEDMEKSLLFWRDALGIQLHELRDVPAEQSQVAFLPIAGAEVELVMPTTTDSGIAKYLAKRGQGMHHLCLEVDDIEGMMAQLKAKNIRLINEEPRISVDGKKYVFIHPESTGGVLVELYQIK